MFINRCRVVFKRNHASSEDFQWSFRVTSTQDCQEPRLEFSDVTIGVLTALEEEYTACREIFDPDRQGVEKEQRATSGTLTCWLCFIPSNHGGNHVVAITRLPHMGNVAAAIAANILFQHCPAIESLIMCGIAGAVPHHAKHENHVRLGDIVVSNMRGIIQYDFGKQRAPQRTPDPDDPFNGFEFRSASHPPCPRLLAAIGRMHADEGVLRRSDAREWEKKIDAFLGRVGNPGAWKRPPLGKDKLIDTPDGTGAAIEHPKDPPRRRSKPRVFHGAIGAANIVLADPKKRDRLRDCHDIRAVEMEGSGVADASWVARIGYLVVRGTCDYCNSTKNDIWHRYAAVIAAAYVRTIIEYLHVHIPSETKGLPTEEQISKMAGATQTNPVLPSHAVDAVPQASTKVPPDHHSGVGPVKRPTSQAIALQPASAANLVIAEELDLNAAVIQGIHFQHSVVDKIEELTKQLEQLLENGRWKEADPYALELEKLLRTMDRRGTVVRGGWLGLARLEITRIRTTAKPNVAPDLTRLKQLRMEAESVID